MPIVRVAGGMWAMIMVMSGQPKQTIHQVTMMVRATCGSCKRVREQIESPVLATGAQFIVVDVDADPDDAVEFGDRVPVILVDGEEFACWEVDTDELVNALVR